jgi:RND family efflux transporter MFP subunit
MGSRGKKHLYLIIVPLVTVVAGGAWWNLRARPAKGPSASVVEARRGDLRVAVQSTGVVEPEYSVEIKSKASGDVQLVTVKEGDRVKQGDLLVRLNPIYEKRRVSQVRAELRMAEASAMSGVAKVRFLRTQVERNRALLAKGLASREEVATLEKELAVQAAEGAVYLAQILKAKEALSEAEDRLVETEVKAPITGTVLERFAQPGQIVASGTTAINGGTTLLKLASLEKLYVRVKVDEADTARLARGQAVTITADALPGRTFGGTVVRVSPQGLVENSVTVFPVVVLVDPEGSRTLRPVMTANVDILVEHRKNVILVAQRALRPGQGKIFQVTMASGQVRTVQVGARHDGLAEILSGLAPGERVRLPAARKPQAARRPQGGVGMRGGMGGFH